MPDCERPTCPYAKEIEMLQEDSRQNRTTHEKFFKRFEDMAVEQGKAGARLDSIFAMLSEIKNDLCALKERPSKRWELVVSALITGVVAVIIAMIFKTA